VAPEATKKTSLEKRVMSILAGLIALLTMALIVGALEREDLEERLLNARLDAFYSRESLTAERAKAEMDSMNSKELMEQLVHHVALQEATEAQLVKVTTRATLVEEELEQKDQLIAALEKQAAALQEKVTATENRAEKAEEALVVSRDTLLSRVNAAKKRADSLFGENASLKLELQRAQVSGAAALARHQEDSANVFEVLRNQKDGLQNFLEEMQGLLASSKEEVEALKEEIALMGAHYSPAPTPVIPLKTRLANFFK
jgi:chromosome segregation ATPase